MIYIYYTITLIYSILLKNCMNIRKAELKDIKQCEKISKIPEFKMENWDLPSANSFKQSINQIFLVAEENEKIIGLILGNKLTKKSVYLDLLTVNEDFRNKKIGKELLLAFKNELKNLNMKQYFLIAPTFNKKTLNFYRKNGLIEGKQYTLFCENMWFLIKYYKLIPIT